MKREIEFRGLTHDTKEWKYGFYAKTKLAEETISLGDARIHNIIIENGTMWHITGGTQGQYTGIKGLYGVKIYEGDIVKVKNSLTTENKHKAVVLFYSNGWCIDLSPYYPKASEGWLRNIRADDEFEVLGNIHTDPHLLEAN